MLLLSSRQREWTRLPKGRHRAGRENSFESATVRYSVEIGRKGVGDRTNSVRSKMDKTMSEP